MPEEDDQEQEPLVPEEAAAPVSGARYLVQESIGHGGMGQVFRAWDQHLGRYVAVKRISEDPGVDAAIRREAGILAALHHPNIVSIFDFAADEVGPFVVMEYVEGRTLEDLVLGQPLEMPNFLELVTQVCRGMSSAHAAGLVHLDLKPGNIMLQLHRDGSFTSKILDFGLARAGHEQAGDEPGEIYGSPYTVTPEQLTKQPTDARTDIYSLGCVFYFALSGKNAFEAATVDDILQRHLQGEVTPLHLIAPKVPQAMSLTITRMLAREPENRPQTVEEVRGLLLKSTRAPAPAQAVAPRPTSGPVAAGAGGGSKSSGGGGGLMILALLVLAGTGAWWYYGQRSPAEADENVSSPAPAAVVDGGGGGKPTVDPADVAVLARYPGREIVVEGTVESITASQLFHARLLKFANVPEGGAMASVREDVMPPDQVQSYLGKRLRVTGQLSVAAGVKRVVVAATPDLMVTGP